MEKAFNLRRCPFCGNPNPIMKKYEADGKERFSDKYAVLCDYRSGGCGAESGWRSSTWEAMKIWNERKRKWEV